jgi:hypothetical protein
MTCRNNDCQPTRPPRSSCPSRIRCQAAIGSRTRSRQCETQRTWFRWTGAGARPPANVSGVRPSKEAWQRAELPPRTFCTLPRELSSDRPTPPIVGEESSAVRGTVDDHFHVDHGPPAAALRPPASASRPTHRRHHRRHGPRSPALDGTWVAWRGAHGRRLSRCCAPHGAVVAHPMHGLCSSSAIDMTGRTVVDLGLLSEWGWAFSPRYVYP